MVRVGLVVRCLGVSVLVSRRTSLEFFGGDLVSVASSAGRCEMLGRVLLSSCHPIPCYR